MKAFNRRWTGFGVAAAAGLVTGGSALGQVDATWIGPNTGNWSNLANWDTSFVPNNGNGGQNYFVIVDGSSGQATSVLMDLNVAIHGLRINAGDLVEIQNDRFLALVSNPMLVNNGTLFVNSEGASTDLRLGVDLTMSGSGLLRLSDNPNNRVLYNFGGIARLTNDTQHTIAGSGAIGLDLLNVDNRGTIQADQVNPLVIDWRGSANSNSGVMRASNGGTLRILNTPLDNTGGVIRANNGSAVSLEGAGIVGGSLTTGGSGGIFATGNVSSLTDVTNLGSLRVPNGAMLVLAGTITNNQIISMEGVNAATDLRLASVPTILTGSGQIHMTDNPNNRLLYNFGGITTLENDVNHTIRGSGQLGLDLIHLTNRGLVQADQPTALVVDLRGDQSNNINLGTMKATSGGAMRIVNTGIDNSGGQLLAEAGSVIQLESSGIVGGALRTTGDGAFQTAGSPSSLTDVTNEGLFRVPNGSFLILAGTIQNEGLISLESTGTATDVRIHTSPVLLTGGGELRMGNNASNRLLYNFGGITRLENDTDHTIRGVGQFGVDLIHLTNRGLIQADQATGLFIDLRGGVADNFNTGMLQAIGGGLMRLVNMGLDNTDGVVRAEAGSVVQLWSSGIKGGVLETDGTGLIQMVGPTSVIDGLVNQGTVSVPDGTSLVLANTVTNNGVLSLESAGNAADIRIGTETVILTGTGELRMSDNGGNRILYNFGNITVLEHEAGHTIRGTGQFGVDLINIINRGTIQSDQPGGMVIDTRGFTQNGTLRVINNSVMTIATAPMTVAGDAFVQTGSTLNRTGDWVQTAGTTHVDGSLGVSSGPFSLQGGVLSGSGNVNVGVNNSGGVVSPGASAGNLRINGAYTQGENGALKIELGGLSPGTEHDVLTVSGAANLNGVLLLSAINGFLPKNGAEFTILNAASRTGQLTVVADESLCDYEFDVTYTATSMVVKANLVTSITGFSVVRGNLMTGGIPELRLSDDQYLRTKSGFGQTFTDLHSMEIVFDTQTTEQSPTHVDVHVESRINSTGGTARVRLWNWNTSQYEQIGIHAIGQVDQANDFLDRDAAKYVSSTGAIRLSVRHVVIVPVFAFRFDSFFDVVRICVD